MSVERLTVQPLAATAQSQNTSQGQNQNDSQQQNQDARQQQSANDGRSRNQYSGDSSNGRNDSNTPTQQHQTRRGFLNQLHTAGQTAA